MYILCMIILVFFAVIGLCAFITALIDRLYQNSDQSELILRDLSPDNAEARIRSAARICLHHTGIKLICVCDEDDPVYDICCLMQKEYPFMEIVPCDRN